jgi:iron complex outermembrane receptor protein
MSIYGKVGQSFRVASVDDNRGLTTPLEPQTSHDAEIGTEYRVDKGARARSRVSHEYQE